MTALLSQTEKTATERFAGLMYWNRKAVTGKFDRLYYVETEKTVTERFAGFMYWSRKAVTGQFDGFIMSKPKKLWSGLPALCIGTEKVWRTV